MNNTLQDRTRVTPTTQPTIVAIPNMPTAGAVVSRRVNLLKTQQIIYSVLGVMEGLITIRFLLRLFAANPGAGFAQFIYGLTGPLLAPFNGLFATPQFEGSVLETTSIVAMVVYALLAWLVMRAMWLIFDKAKPIS
jgi:uncharacterized protein YggT (Ycf19 family)